MPKRKRDGDVEAAVKQGGENSNAKRLRAEQRVHHGQTLLARAFKTAKGFERQKLSRRRKTAQNQKDGKDVARIDAETEALKILDLAKVSASYLTKSLLKIKAIAASSDLPPSLTVPPQQPADPAALNVVARLCKSGPVRDALPSILTDVQKVLGVAEGDSHVKSGGEAASNGVAKSSKLDAGEPGSNDSRPTRFETSADDSSETFQGFSTAADDMSDDADGLAEFDDRLASSDEDSTNEALSSTVNLAHRALLQQRGSDTDGEVPIESDNAGAVQPSKARIKNTKREKSLSLSPPPHSPTKKITTSAFLPTLTSGFISGSESDPDTGFDDLSGKSNQKKNRRGQRARQKIWEQKYREEAKHLKNQANKAGSRNQGWDARRGATDGSRPGRGKFVKGTKPNGSRTAGPSGENAQPLGKKPKHRDDDGPIHPSWEAAKRRKEAGQPSAAKFEGKKITFD